MAAGLALVAAAIHAALAAADLIPGEPTRGWAFAAMATGYLACAVAIFVRRADIDALISLYAVGLILAYAITRDTQPVEIIGLASKAAEAGVALIAGGLFVRASR